ncbi:MAG: hypothetical protein M1498_02955 [Candidatus Thermoplasmatota archaeon]|nr:hypothetical protein [Candidatus Thermoplasmatota archaeon]MCL5888606.1 hypothetical protein [Candidatus Thermoplasmatota archaeon]
MAYFSTVDYAIFLIVVIAALFTGFIAYLWRKPKNMNDIEEWGLGGRRFGTVVIWFLLGGDLYTAYTLIAVPGLAASSGALAMFAITYGIMIFPIVYATMPRLYTVSNSFWRFLNQRKRFDNAKIIYSFKEKALHNFLGLCKRQI